MTMARRERRHRHVTVAESKTDADLAARSTFPLGLAEELRTHKAP